MHLPTRNLLVLAIVASAAGTLAWNHENAWHDPAANTASASAKPGGGGLYGTGSLHEGGIRCEHCHLPAIAVPSLGVNVTFTPALVSGHYAAGTRYTVKVDLVNERALLPDAGTGHNNFAGSFEDPGGTPAGVLESDSGQLQTSCPATAPTTYPGGSTTLLYGDCHGILSRFTNVQLDSWTFYWTAPASTAGIVTFSYGAVDGNGNGRTMDLDGGPDDFVKMGSMMLLP